MFLFRANVKRHAMTGSRLDLYVRPVSPRVSAGTGNLPSGSRKKSQKKSGLNFYDLPEVIWI